MEQIINTRILYKKPIILTIRTKKEGGFFNFEGIEFPKKIKTMAYQKILQNVEDLPEE